MKPNRRVGRAVMKTPRQSRRKRRQRIRPRNRKNRHSASTDRNGRRHAPLPVRARGVVVPRLKPISSVHGRDAACRAQELPSVRSNRTQGEQRLFNLRLDVGIGFQRQSGAEGFRSLTIGATPERPRASGAYHWLCVVQTRV